MTIKDDFAERLRLLRAERGLSQIDLATQAGIAPAQLSRYELGKSYPRAEVLAKLADALGVSRRELATKGPERGVSVSLPMDLIAKLSESAAKRLGVDVITRDEMSDEVRIRLEESFAGPRSSTHTRPDALEVVAENLFAKLRSRFDKILADAIVEHGFKEELAQRIQDAMSEQQRLEIGLEKASAPAEGPVLVQTSRDAMLKPLRMVANIAEGRPRSRTPKIPGQNAPKEGLGGAPRAEKPKKEKPMITKKRVFVRDDEPVKITLDHTSKKSDD
ncbi:helix-turn-helix domain-containing protein [Achromobacter aegrifaciens]|uniref:Anaerobic benzoate catabolism transcriptional regulator n=1 Tax=Achromobacter aegrifaciens TaxID=1287736 RepID=A0AAD2QDA0_ACHAE|nr:helix-turn-helix domain-containing protein [Achromobacter aegrifaciens]CUJ01191.1 anaerobic benzoate catabolism transcriptional regulator [Achromobacter aegrifaciens]